MISWQVILYLKNQAIVKKRVETARNLQYRKFNSSTKTNADMSVGDIKKYCVLDDPAKKL
jgi:magnesium chelatase family protein